ERVRPARMEDQSFLEELKGCALPRGGVGVVGRVAGDPLDDAVKIDHRAGKAIHGGDDDVIARPNVPDECSKLRTVVGALPGGVLGECLVALPYGLQLPSGILVDGGDADVGDPLPARLLRGQPRSPPPADMRLDRARDDSADASSATPAHSRRTPGNVWPRNRSAAARANCSRAPTDGGNHSRGRSCVSYML